MPAAKSIEVLLIQLGTPDDASVPAVRRYLREFLSDRRVIETNPLIWKPLLYGVILLTRPAQSAAKYRRIWTEAEGMPLLRFTRLQAEKLQLALGEGFRVRFAMQVGNPNLREIVPELAG